MILCDTNVFISAFNDRHDTIAELESIGYENIVISAITVMELYQGMGNKMELNRMKKKIKYYDIIQVNANTSARAIELVELI
jgi:hypothetical protein